MTKFSKYGIKEWVSLPKSQSIDSIAKKMKAKIAMLFLLTLLLVTCSSSTEKPNPVSTKDSNSLTVWWTKGFYPGEDEGIKKIVANWERESGMEAELTILSEDENVLRTQSSLETGNPPDIVYNRSVDVTLSPLYASEGKLADVSDVVQPMKNIYTKTALESVYLYNNVAKKRSYYAVPIQQQTNHIHYWEDILEDIGLSSSDIPSEWDAFWEFWQRAQNVAREKGYPEIYGLGLNLSAEASDTFYQMEQTLEAYNVRLLDENGKLLLDDPQVRQGAIAVITWLTDLYREGYIPPDAVDWEPPDNNVAFLNRKLLMVCNGTLSLPASQRQDADTYKKRMKTIEYPRKADGEPSKYQVSVKQVLTFSQSKHPEAAKDFLSYLIQPENLAEYLEGSAGRYFPVMPQLLAEPFWQDESDPHISAAAKQFREGATRPMYQALNPAYSQVLAENVWGHALERAIVDDRSPTEAADEAIARIKEIFAEWENS